MHPYILYVYIVTWVFLSLVTFMLYSLDKKKAKDAKWRIKEKTLLLFSFLLGSIGGLMGLYLVRHKTKHWYFVVINWGSFILHLAIAYYLYTIIGNN